MKYATTTAFSDRQDSDLMDYGLTILHSVSKSKVLNHAGYTIYKTQSHPNSIMTKIQLIDTHRHFTDKR